MVLELSKPASFSKDVLVAFLSHFVNLQCSPKAL